jgi:hypothetical protein
VSRRRRENKREREREREEHQYVYHEIKKMNLYKRKHTRKMLHILLHQWRYDVPNCSWWCLKVLESFFFSFLLAQWKWPAWITDRKWIELEVV